MKNKIIIIGGFRKTKILAVDLLKKGYKVIAVNDNREHCQLLSEIDGLKVYCGDGTLPSVLLDAGVKNCRTAIAIMDNDEDNLVTCQLCKKRFGIQKAISLVGNPNKTDFFRRMGVDSVICAVERITDIIRQQATIDKISNSFVVGEGKVNISEVKMESGYPVINKMLKDIGLPNDIIVGCILRGERAMIPRGETTILAGDILLLISEIGAEEKAFRLLAGE